MIALILFHSVFLCAQSSSSRCASPDLCYEIPLYRILRSGPDAKIGENFLRETFPNAKHLHVSHRRWLLFPKQEDALLSFRMLQATFPEMKFGFVEAEDTIAINENGKDSMSSIYQILGPSRWIRAPEPNSEDIVTAMERVVMGNVGRRGRSRAIRGIRRMDVFNECERIGIQIEAYAYYKSHYLTVLLEFQWQAEKLLQALHVNIPEIKWSIPNPEIPGHVGHVLKLVRRARLIKF